jgi:hypothetical protein
MQVWALSALLLAGCSRTTPPVAASDALPDWSGVWAITDQSFLTGALADSGFNAETAHNQNLVPLKPQYQEERTKSGEILPGVPTSGNLLSCMPSGMPGVMQHPMMTEYLFTPGRVTVLFEDGEVRRIYTDGRSHPPSEELEYGYQGDSIGHWEGSTLVVDTVGISPKADLLLNNGVRVTRNTHVVERIALKDPQSLQIDTVVSDDELFTKPYAYSRTYQRTPLPIQEPSCASKNRDNDREVDLTPPAP